MLTLLVYALTSLIIFVIGFTVPESGIPRTLAWESVFDLLPNLLKHSRILFVLVVFIVVPGLAILLAFYKNVSHLSFGDTLHVSLVSAVFAFYLFLVVSFAPGSAVIKVLLIAILSSAVFANGLGFYLKESEIHIAPLTRVLFESEKDEVAGIEGKIIFDLDRYLLLWMETKPVHLVAIPHEKIKSIQTPPLPQEQKSAAIKNGPPDYHKSGPDQ